MLRGPLRLFLSVALSWAAMNVCLMPQAECEGKTPVHCHCHHGSLPKCCHGVHLIEAGVQSGVSIAAPAPQQAALAQPGPVAEPGAVRNGPHFFVVLTVPLHPPPRESIARSPPVA
jgi:hypothetical protein